MKSLLFDEDAFRKTLGLPTLKVIEEDKKPITDKQLESICEFYKRFILIHLCSK